MGMLMHHSLMRSAGEEPDKREGVPIEESLSFEKPDLPEGGLYSEAPVSGGSGDPEQVTEAEESKPRQTRKSASK